MAMSDPPQRDPLEEQLEWLGELARRSGAHSREDLVDLVVALRRQGHAYDERVRRGIIAERLDTAGELVRESLPNFLGTVFGGLVLALLAIVAGVLGDVGTGWAVVIAVLLVAGGAGAVALAARPRSFDEGAARRNAGTLAELFVEEEEPAPGSRPER